MNYNFISQLLDNGFDSDQLIALLVKNAPNLGSKIKNLLAGGWGSNEILSYVNKDPESSRINLKNAKPATSEEIAALQAYKANRGADKSRDKQALEDLTRFTKGAFKVGGAIAAPYLGGQALQAGMGAIESLMKPSNIEPGPGIGKQIEQQASDPVTQAVQPNPTIPSPPPTQPPNTLQLLEQHGFKKHLDQIANKTPDTLEGITKFRFPNEVKKFEKETNITFRKAIEEYMSSIPKQQELSPNKETKDNEIGSSVLLPDGQIGEIESVKQGIAKVIIGDVIRNKKLNELMQSPKEAATAALELIKSFTPEHLRSAHHALNMYDPETKSAQFLFHNGEGYVIEDISPEEYERLSKELDAAKTTGETKIGAWATGAGSRGAAYQKIVKNLKKPYRKIMVGYNLFKEFQRLINEKE